MKLNKNVNWTILIILGCLLIYAQVRSSSDVKISMGLGIMFIALGMFKFAYPKKHLLWLSADRENLLVSGLAYTTVVLIAVFSLMGLLCY